MSEIPTTQPAAKQPRTRDKFKVMQAIVKDFNSLSPNDQAWVMGELQKPAVVAPVVPSAPAQG